MVCALAMAPGWAQAAVAATADTGAEVLIALAVAAVGLAVLRRGDRND